MATKFRKSPPVCLSISLIRLMLGKLRLSGQLIGQTVKMKDDQAFTIFRHITRFPVRESNTKIVFIVSFKFSRLAHRSNKIVSIMPMLLITGFPGFSIKIYGVNRENGYWQGMYQWETKSALEEYKQSFVFKIMNKRAIPDSLNSFEITNQNLHEYLKMTLAN